MKMRISIEQLNKLTDEQRESLKEWWKPELGDWYKVGVYSLVCNDKALILDTCYPLLSIGQMIQFIQEKKQLKGISKNRFNKWFINIDTAMLGYKDELCDALWETAKQLLKSA